MQVSDLSKESCVAPKQRKRDQHIESLETRVDELEEQVTSLKKQLKLAREEPKETVSKEEHNATLAQLQAYWDTLHPF